ncbi:hypothetical protein EJ08DRAFT_691958 [Tothia fuscella]|uniref:Uncharacterized protein n=1 Tax=Tothia fuscella TaxID=1048955 RepID=A0A9P4U4L2_9PEZI|nr:hypothetical protein EJ08DRAFT_691958 [Tothia fuscella]
MAKEGTDSGYGDSLVDKSEQVFGQELQTLDSDITEEFSDAHQSLPQSQRNEDQQRRSHYAAASVKSVSSAPSSKSSRRDSAISASSKSRRRVTTVRSASQQTTTQLTNWTSAVDATSARPYLRRIISSPQVQTKKPNIEEALALHERSIRIFGASSRPTTSSGVPMISSKRPSIYRSVTTSEGPMRSAFAIPKGRMRSLTSPAEVPRNHPVEQEPQYNNFVPATIMHWTSHETRRRQYDHIDKSNKGLRGFFKRLFPKFSKSSESRFYDERDGSDAGSVRRFRLDFPDEAQTEQEKK